MKFCVEVGLSLKAKEIGLLYVQINSETVLITSVIAYHWQVIFEPINMIILGTNTTYVHKYDNWPNVKLILIMQLCIVREYFYIRNRQI